MSRNTEDRRRKRVRQILDQAKAACAAELDPPQELLNLRDIAQAVYDGMTTPSAARRRETA